MTTHAAKGAGGADRLPRRQRQRAFHDSHLPRACPVPARKGERQTTGFLWRASGGHVERRLAGDSGWNCAARPRRNTAACLYCRHDAGRRPVCSFCAATHGKPRALGDDLARDGVAQHSAPRTAARRSRTPRPARTIHPLTRVSGEAVGGAARARSRHPAILRRLPEALGRKLAPRSGTAAAAGPFGRSARPSIRPLIEAGTGRARRCSTRRPAGQAVASNAATAVHQACCSAPARHRAWNAARTSRLPICAAPVPAWDAGGGRGAWAEVAAIWMTASFAALFAPQLAGRNLGDGSDRDRRAPPRHLRPKIDRSPRHGRANFAGRLQDPTARRQPNSARCQATHVAQMSALIASCCGRSIRVARWRPGLLYTAAPRLLTLSPEPMDSALAGLARA